MVFTLFCQKESDPKVLKGEENTKDTRPRILFFGDSLTAGYGLDDVDLAWPRLVTDALKKEGYDYQMTNAGVSGDTSSGGLGRIEWVLEERADIFVLELGANDMLRGISPEVTKKNLKSIIHEVKARYPNCSLLLVGMKATPNLGKAYQKSFDSLYLELAKEEGIELMPFLLESVAGIRKWNQKDGIHPTEEGHKLVAQTALPFFRRIAKQRQALSR
ncbi:GDSL-like protein [Leptospira ryugenii]|uniref:GDSL-like protein n=1 Tax=Leptospira ryugenii TaxID=1917863 RepID=A0A2P2E0S8_9LEPT|nr:arylesterase [Leptospira ryugenii]GBF50491.1 GDSL-like protein [Leptospira ryugenii]